MALSDAGATATLVSLMGVRGASARVHLYKNAITPVPSSLPADFTPCDFDGYQVLTSDQWDGPTAQDDGTALARSPWFQVTKGPDLSKAQSIYGMWLGFIGPKTGGVIEQYADGFRFDPPVSMRTAGATLRFKLDVAAARAVDDGKTSLIIGTALTAAYETYKVRGLFRARLKALARRLQSLIDDEARRAADADFGGTAYDSVFVNPQSDVAAGIILARCQDLLSR